MLVIEKYSIDSLRVTITALMEAAGLKVAEAVMELLTGVEKPKVALVCGKGNNGGDGLAAARHLTANGIENDVYLIGSAKSLKGEALANLQILQKTQAETLNFVTKAAALDLSRYDLVVDAVLGTGTSGELRDPVKPIVEGLSSYPNMIVAVDMPTGVNSDDGSVGEFAVKADVTVTMGIPKLGMYFSPGRELCGRVLVAQIGFPASALEEGRVDSYIPEQNDIAGLIPELDLNTYKQRAGKVLAIGGSKGMTGAIVLSSRAALSTGCGLVKTAVPASLNDIFEVKLTEEMTLPVDDGDNGFFTPLSSSGLIEHYEWADSILIGPGLGNDPQTAEFVVKVAESTRIPMVIDADALSVFKERRSLIAHLGASAVLTPHHAEFAEAFEFPIDMVKKNPVSLARETAVKYGINLVLKGAPTVTADPDGMIYINPTGNPGMATAGSGDVLTGMIASLIAQGLTPKDAALSGVYMHGLAGDAAAAELGQRPMKASDIIKYFPAMFKTLA